MAVFRIERTRDYTVMSNHHLRNANLSLKAKGLLSMMLSLPEDWNYTTRGLAKICKEGVDAIGAALRELEGAGYIVRHQRRDKSGRITDTEYVIYEQPQPDMSQPDTASPDTENPDMVRPDMEKPAELNIEKSNTEKSITYGSSTDSIPFRETAAARPPERKGRDAMSVTEMEPHRQCKHKCNDTRRLKWSGITPKYNFRYADDWVILTSTEQEAFRMKHELTKYFKHRMKLELSQEKTYVTDLRKNGIHFLGYIVKAERKRKTPDPATWSDNLVGKPFPDMERLTKKIHTLQKEVRKIGLYTQSNTQAAQIQYVNSVIMGLAQYLQPSICSHAYHAIDRRVNNTALAVWKNLFPKQYNQMQVPLKELSNLPHRHEGYDSKTFAIQIDGKWFGITYAFITHSRYESKPFDQKMTPYTEDGRRRYVNYRTKHKPLPCDRPSINTPEDIALSIYASGKGWRANFEYFMNREYAYNRDKGKCKCCGRYFSELIPKHCHHVNPRLPIERINKIPNLAWLCIPCHRMVHNSPIPPELDAKAVRKIKKYREKLKK